jgi:hypothetical protein
MYQLRSYVKAWSVLAVFAVAATCAANNPQPFPALVGNALEARVGSTVHVDAKKLRLDIGASIPVIEIQPRDEGWITFGADFSTYTRLRSENNFKFPVETSDYFFGVNFQWQHPDSTWSARTRIAHISSHLVDGLADSTGAFRSTLPFVYSREFVDVAIAYSFDVLRVYAGSTVVWATQPRSANRIIPQLGADVRYNVGDNFWVVGGYDAKLIGVHGAYQPQHAAQVGVFVNLWQDRGVLLSVAGAAGRSMHGMFFTEQEQYWGIGFQIFQLWN